MKRITISLADELYAAVEREARRRAVSVSRVIREAIEEWLGFDADGNPIAPPGRRTPPGGPGR